jgi:hypothetical protein
MANKDDLLLSRIINGREGIQPIKEMRAADGPLSLKEEI